MIAVLALLVFASTMAVDYAHARYIQSLTAGHRHAAARWSVTQWAATMVGFVVAVRVTMWVLPAEALGLYCGTFLGSRERGTRETASGV